MTEQDYSEKGSPLPDTSANPGEFLGSIWGAGVGTFTPLAAAQYVGSMGNLGLATVFVTGPLIPVGMAYGFVAGSIVGGAIGNKTAKTTYNAAKEVYNAGEFSAQRVKQVLEDDDNTPIEELEGTGNRSGIKVNTEHGEINYKSKY